MAWAGEGFARGLISTCGPSCPLFNIYHSKFDNSHISIWQLTNAELGPVVPSPFFSTPPGVCWKAPIDQQLRASASRAPGLGRGKSKPAWRLPSSLAHLKSASQQGCVVPSLHLLLLALYSPYGGTDPP